MASALFPYNSASGRSGLPIKAPVAARQTAKDTNTENSKKPSPEIGRPQTSATGGDTLPIVFAKKATTCGTGGVWIQPQIIKKGTWEGKSQYLLAVSQGDLGLVPPPSLTFHGGSRLASDQGDKSVTKYYKTNAELTTNKLDCPIGGDSFDCRQDVATVVLELSVGNARSFKSFDPPIGSYFQGILSVHGSGDITNTEIEMPGTGLVVIDDDSGDDITTEWWDARPATPAGTTFHRNRAGAGFATPCLPAGFVDDPFPPDLELWEGWDDIPGYTGNRTVIFNNVSINNQSDPTVAATNGTLDFNRWEYKISKVPDPSNPPTTDPVTNYPTDYTAFGDMTLLEVEGDLERYEPSITGDIKPQNDQISIFIEQGIKVSLFSEGTPTVSGASNKFVDLMMFFFQLLKRQDPASVTTLGQPVEISNLQALATFEDNYKLWFNGVIEQQVNIIDYVSTVSEFFLMRFISRNGIYGLQPLLPLNGSNQIDVTALTPTATFTDSDILQGSFAKQFIDNNERRDMNATVAWNYTTCDELGYENSTIVRYATTPIDAPLMQFDMTDFCALIDHATLYAKYFLAKRRHSTHSIGFQVPLLTSELIPTQIIKVVRQRVTSRGDNRTETEWYQVTEVKHSTDGISTIQASHFPVNGSNISKISDDVVNGSFTVA